MSSVPDYAQIPFTNFIIDYFRYAKEGKVYFLSHGHSDHYAGLSPTWSSGPVYCSPPTARLLVVLLEVPPQYIRELPLNVPRSIEGVEVTALPAHHCPGAVQFLFRLPSGRSYLHTGDLRFTPSLLANPHLARLQGRLTALHLDTTYCNPRHAFPPQEESVEYIVTRICSMLAQPEYANAAIYIATYVIGKEKILLEVVGA